MIDPNKKFNVVMGIVAIMLIVASIVMWYLIIRREASRSYFKLSEIENASWIHDFDSFEIKNKNVKLTIDSDEVVNGKYSVFESDTGKIVVNDDEIYIRSIASDSIVIWYNEKEYHFNKYIEAK